MTFGLDAPSVATVRDKWGWFLALGILLLIFGFLALANLFVATVASVFYIGMMMLIGGIAYLVHAFQVKGWDHILFWAASGILYTIAGLLAFWNPALTAAIVTFFMAVTLIVAGTFRLWVGLRMRPMRGSGWVVFGGVITGLAGLVIAFGWPVNSLWILGLFLAIDLTIQGWALIAVALAAKA
ncbi:HdeD family acid-resistance protein [Neorhizobium galegae]|uniref:HdeD protein n=2 Tax=Neorhizobium galegae TaxID=399 RepID=A0A068SL11_NEOGA|nr:HdeD family acid-resistance protein [Neorhizobium galegae]KAB1085619.1 HdeD family acid-resistance protein [Neorhizobium galegae]MCQ1849844.1 HdeD family acid-resistance protein [Neorhizobium galegae]CDN46887.1 HdeD protein [Neorhizobium galegae bv. orientalis str. HAMBI 540]CDZ53514.1 HdeD protein [Neorhizobium galegae bv. orientalis]